MNITAEYWAEMTNDIANIVAAGVPNANTTTMGGVEIATDAEVIAGTNTGGTGASLVATPGQIKTEILTLSNSITPVVRVYTAASTNYGDTTSRFDITSVGGNTRRYTWDGTGTDPGITAITFPTGAVVVIMSQVMDKANTGTFIVTGSGANYFEVTNASGFAEADKTLQQGYLKKLTAQTWTKPAGLKYAVVEVQGGGGRGQNATGASPNFISGNGGGGGGYVKKLIAVASLGTTESLWVGIGGLDGGANYAPNGASSIFGSSLIAGGGNGGTQVGTGGTASGGDVNIIGGGGNLGGTNVGCGLGGSSHLGGTGTPAQSSALYGGGGGGGPTASAGGSEGANGVIIVTEFY